MLKKLTLILLCAPGLLAMTQVKQSSTLKLELSDGTEIEVPRHLAELSETICGTLELIDDDKPLSLPQLTKADWELVYERLVLAYRFTTEKTNNARKALLASLTVLSADELLSCMMIVDYLAVPVVLEACLERAYAGHLNTLSYEQLTQLPQGYIYEIIFRRACTQCGPYKAVPLVSYKGHNDWLTALYITHDGNIVSGSWDGTVRVWNTEGIEPAVCRGHEGSITALSITHDGNIVSGSWDGTVRVWNTEGIELAVCRGHEGGITALSITHDDKIVSGSEYKSIRVWDTEGNQLAVCDGLLTITAICETRDDKVVSGAGDGRVRIWDTKSNQLVVCEGHEGLISAVCVTRSGKIVSGSNDTTVRIWDTDGKELAVCKGHEDVVRSVCITPDGKIVSGSKDGTVRVWDIDGNELAVCKGHEDYVYAVCVTPDGKIVSGSEDTTVRVWDIEGNELAVCEGHEDFVNSVCVAPDGKIVSGSEDTTVRIWDMTLPLTDVQAEKVWLYLVEDSNVEVTPQDGWDHIKQILIELENCSTNEKMERSPKAHV